MDFLSNLLLTLMQFSDQQDTSNSDNGAGRVVGYFTTWSSRSFSPTQAQLLTHVNIAFAIMDAAGSLSFNDGGQTVLQVRQVANGYPNLKVMFSIGGGTNSQYFSNITANPDLTNTLIANILNIIDNYSLDGVDIDWENPTTSDDKSNYVLLMQKMRYALDQHQVQ
jgi:chitinase